MHLVLKAVFLTTQGTQLRIERDAFRVERPSEPLVRIPVRQVDTVVAHGHITITTEALHRAAAEGISVVLLSRAGRFLARMEGPTSGNVLLRTEQFRRTQQPA